MLIGNASNSMLYMFHPLGLNKGCREAVSLMHVTLPMKRQCLNPAPCPNKLGTAVVTNMGVDLQYFTPFMQLFVKYLLQRTSRVSPCNCRWCLVGTSSLQPWYIALRGTSIVVVWLLEGVYVVLASAATLRCVGLHAWRVGLLCCLSSAV
jgi:hypothetical protein